MYFNLISKGMIRHGSFKIKLLLYKIKKAYFTGIKNWLIGKLQKVLVNYISVKDQQSVPSIQDSLFPKLSA